MVEEPHPGSGGAGSGHRRSDVPPSRGSAPFGLLLRQHRVRRALTQERLAELARISPAAVAALEAGRRRAPRLSTVALLCDALGLDEAERSELATASGGLAAPSAVGRAPAAVAEPGRGPGGHLVRSAMFFEPIGGWPHPFVGRRSQLALLLSALDHRQRVVLVAGEAGIGKTRLVDEVAKRSIGRGLEVLCGNWTPYGLGPFEGFVGPLRQALASLGQARADEHPDLARLLPELGPQPAPADLPGHGYPEVERHLLFGAVAEVLRSVGPTLLLLDDLQWADQASLALLFDLATDRSLGELVLMATIRAGELPAKTRSLLVDLERRSDVQWLELGALSATELEELIGEVIGGAAPEGAATSDGDAIGGEALGSDDSAGPELLAAVARLSEGNPFFAQELAEQLLGGAQLLGQGQPAGEGRLLRQGRRPGDGAGGLARLETMTALPERIRNFLAQRLAVLAPPTRAFLGAGAVLGRDWDPMLAGRLVELDAAGAIAATEDALLAGIVVEVSTARLSFSHSLMQTAVELDLAAIRRLDLHRRAASELELTAPGGSVPAADLARHWAAVATVDPSATSRAAHWAVLAGNEAMAAAATDEAIASYERAVRLWSVDTAEHGATLVRLGEALHACGRGSEADEKFVAALHLAEALGDPRLQAHAAIGFGRALVMGSVDPARVAALERALEVLGHDEPVLRTLVLAMLLRQLSFERSGQLRRRDEIAAELEDVVKRPGLPAELLLSLGSVRELVASKDPDVLDRLSKATIAVARERRDLVVAANAWWTQAWSALERGHPEDWRLAVAEQVAAAEALGLEHELAHAARIASTAAQIEGRMDDAELHGAEALSHGRAANDQSAEMLALAHTALLGMERGRADALLPVMEELSRDHPSVSSFRAGLALVAGLAGEHALARRLLDAQALDGFARIHVDVEWLAVVSFYAHASYLVGAADHAKELYPLLASSPARAVRVGPLVGWWGPTDHHLGMLCRLTGDLSRARWHLRRAVRIETALGAGPFLARTRSALAELGE